MYDFSGKIALVTGASQGIGAALAMQLAAEGCQLSLLSRDDQAVHKVALGAKKDFAVDAIARACDIRDSHRVGAVIDETVRRFGRLDLVINNAATLGDMAPLSDYDPEKWRYTMDVNLNGAFYVSHFALAAMRKNAGGRMVLVSSSVGHTPRPSWGAYSISKYGVEGLVKLIAAESEESHVLCCSINPGGTATEMRRSAFPSEDQSSLPSPEQIAKAFVKIIRQQDKQFNGRAFNARDFLK